MPENDRKCEKQRRGDFLKLANTKLWNLPKGRLVFFCFCCWGVTTARSESDLVVDEVLKNMEVELEVLKGIKKPHCEHCKKRSSKKTDTVLLGVGACLTPEGYEKKTREKYVLYRRLMLPYLDRGGQRSAWTKLDQKTLSELRRYAAHLAIQIPADVATPNPTLESPSEWSDLPYELKSLNEPQLGLVDWHGYRLRELRLPTKSFFPQVTCQRCYIQYCNVATSVFGKNPPAGLLAMEMNKTAKNVVQVQCTACPPPNHFQYISGEAGNVQYDSKGLYRAFDFPEAGQFSIPSESPDSGHRHSET